VEQEQIDDRGRLFRFFTCRTRDGGKSWRTSHFDAYYAAPHFLDKHIIWNVSDLGLGHSRPTNYIQIDDGLRWFPLAVVSMPHVRFVDLDFFNRFNAWASFTDGKHAGLVATTDGGKSWRPMSLPENGEPLKLH
jgi:photosystem II stability/assembly factor-like uncharacterized protein